MRPPRGYRGSGRSYATQSAASAAWRLAAASAPRLGWRPRRGFCHLPLSGSPVADYNGVATRTGMGSASPFQLAFLIEHVLEQARGAAARGAGRPFVVCETGFNWGASAAAFLCAARNVRVLSVDLPVQAAKDAYQAPAVRWLQQYYGAHRLLLLQGSSTRILPALGSTSLARRCDLVSVDGGHATPTAIADMLNFAKLARPGALMIADDCNSKLQGGRVGPYRAFGQVTSSGLVQYVGDVNFTDGTNRRVCIGRYV